MSDLLLTQQIKHLFYFIFVSSNLINHNLFLCSLLQGLFGMKVRPRLLRHFKHFKHSSSLLSELLCVKCVAL